VSASAVDQDGQNVDLATDDKEVERLLTAFHEVLPWPWKTMRLRSPLDAEFYPRALNIAAGHLKEPAVPLTEARIWVAGCGIVQAVQTALDYPNAQVVGSNISQREVELAHDIANQVGAQNLDVRQENINAVDYAAEFDYVICTGVLHHQANPPATLRLVARSLKPNGILELMVYNRFHRFATSAFQKAMRIMTIESEDDHFEQLRVARTLLGEADENSSMRRLHDQIAGMPDVAVGDALIYPVEHSYTVRSLAEMATASGLRLATPRVNPFDEVSGADEWELRIADPELARRYERLDDQNRWYVTNLLRLERSPLLWFFLQSNDTKRNIPDQATLAGEFLDTVFRRNSTTLRSYLLDSGERNRYRLSRRSVEFPSRKPDPGVLDIYEMIDGTRSMREIFRDLGLPVDMASVNRARTRLTSMQFPYLTIT
jgi:2-polyprenyl-3-methyl-5-hydroxy-6-metoxy-1,4-benzoquinol methylase